MKNIANIVLHFLWTSYRKLREKPENIRYAVLTVFGVGCIIGLATIITMFQLPKLLTVLLILFLCGIVSSLIMDIMDNEDPETLKKHVEKREK